MLLRLAHTTSGAAHDGRSVLALAAAQLGSSSLFASAGHSADIRLWRATAAGIEPSGEIRPGGGSVFSLEASPLPGGDCLLLAGSFSRVVFAWRLREEPGGGTAATPLWQSAQHTGWVRALAIDPAEAAAAPRAAYSIGCNRILSWAPPLPPPDAPAASGVTAQDEIALYEDEEQVRSKDILCLAASTGGALAAGSVDGRVRCWRVGSNGVPTGVPVRWAAHAGRVSCVRFTPGGGGLLTAGLDGAVKRWAHACSPGGARLLSQSALLPRVHSLALTGGHVHAGVEGEVVSLEGESLSEVGRVALPPREAGAEAEASGAPRVTALATGRGLHGALLAGDSSGRLHLLVPRVRE